MSALWRRNCENCHKTVIANLSPTWRRILVDEVHAGWKALIHDACGVLRTDASTDRYKGERALQAGLARRSRATARTRVRYGWGHVHVPLRRKGRSAMPNGSTGFVKNLA